jgi:hypothetical protein
MGQSDQASFSHIDKNTSTNFALKQAASGATHLNTPTGQHIRFSVNAAEVGRFTGAGDFKVGANKLYVDTSASEVQMYSQATGSTAGPDLVLMRNNGNNVGANNQYIGQIRYEGLSSTGNSRLYAKTTGKIKTATNGSEDGVIETMIKTGGSNRISVRHSGDKFLIQKGTDLQVGEVANLYVDTSTSRVGIKKSNPSYTLDVDGDINLSGDFYQGGSPFVSSLWTSSGTDLYYSSGSVGVSNAAPDHDLSVGSNLYVHDTGSNVLVVDGNVNVSNTLTVDRLTLNNVSISTIQDLAQVSNVGNVTSNVLQFTNPTTAFVTTGAVGIGTTSPAYKLDVHGSANVGALTATTISGPVSGNASTATALATARTIGGVSFDGTANIDLPGVNTSGTQNTSGNAATATTATNQSGGTVNATTGNFSSNVGIGTTSTDGTFHSFSVTNSGMGNNLHTQRADNNSYYSFFKQRAIDFGTDPIFHFKATEYNEDAVANGPYLRVEGRQGTSFLEIEQNGNVGIGTNSPKTLTHIGKLSSSSTTNETIPSSNIGVSASFPGSTTLWLSKHSSAQAEDYWGMALGTLYTSGNSYIQTLDKSNSSYYNLLLQPNGGYVGIGTTSPIRVLDSRSGDGDSSAGWISGAFGPATGLSTNPRVVVGAFSNVAIVASHRGDLNAWADLYLNNPTYPVVVKTNGSVGIGTASPRGKLDIYTGATSTAGLIIDRYSSGHYRTEFYQESDGLAIKVGDSSAPSEMMRVTPSRIGIGTTSSKALTHIAKYSSGSGTHNTIPSANMGISASFPDSTNLWLAKRATSSGEDYWGMALGTLYTGGNSYIQTLNKNNSDYYNLLLQPNGGDVGIRTTSPSCALDVGGSINNGTYAVSNGYMANRSLTVGDHGVNYGGGTGGWHSSTAGLLLECLDTTEIGVHDSGTRVASFMYFEGGSTNRFTIGRSMGWGAISSIALHGNVGIGTNAPLAALDVPHYVSGTISVNNNQGGYWFSWNTTGTKFYNNQSANVSGNFDGGCVTAHTFYAGYSIQFLSDRRIKKDIREIDDESALEKFRLLKPSKYKYIEPLLSGRTDKEVYGFIAQEVAEVLPEGVTIGGSVKDGTNQGHIPNIMSMCSIESQSISSDAYENLGTEQKGEYIETGNTYTRHVVTITKTIDPSTFNVDGSTRSYKFVEQTNTTGAFDKNSDGKYHPLIFYSNDLKTICADVVRVIDDSSFVVDKKLDLNQYEDGELLLYGQKPDDFYRLNKDSIFTLASAALQEVDRQQQADKVRIAELETQVASLLERVTALENA